MTINYNVGEALLSEIMESLSSGEREVDVCVKESYQKVPVAMLIGGFLAQRKDMSVLIVSKAECYDLSNLAQCATKHELLCRAYVRPFDIIIVVDNDTLAMEELDIIKSQNRRSDYGVVCNS